MNFVRSPFFRASKKRMTHAATSVNILAALLTAPMLKGKVHRVAAGGMLKDVGWNSP
ncbi:hypothetical protein [Mesorhizobium sp. WSM2239]|uniref:Uncharacterized protein n=2 Tax=unclassified Mesorhizobium TaxID=325217 RepID=A0AAU8DD96_9HYPH